MSSKKGALKFALENDVKLLDDGMVKDEMVNRSNLDVIRK